MENVYDVAIIGSGPAGLTAGVYTSRANLKTVIIGGRLWGGQPMTTTMVENFPGWPEGIMGPELIKRIRSQAENYGAEVLEVNLEKEDFSKSPFELLTDDGKKIFAKTVIIATGADTRWLSVPGEKEKIGHGVASCATCDAGFYRGKNVIVVGGGDVAMEDALALAKFADKVFIVHRREQFRASEIMQERTLGNPKITFVLDTKITEVIGGAKVEKVKLETSKPDFIITENDKVEKKVSPEELDGALIEKDENRILWELPIDGVFVAIGRTPNSVPFQDIEKDESGYIKTTNFVRTNIPGIFAAGDVIDPTYKQSITAAGFGAMAALEADRFLREGHK